MNRVNIRELFKNVSSKLMQEFSETERSLAFPPDRGGQREEAIRRFLTEKLPKRYGVSKGFVVSSEGIQSDQCDVIIYDADSTPIFYADINQEVFPIETVYCVIQVKSRLTPTTLDEAIKNIKSFKEVPREDLTSLPLGPGKTSMSLGYGRPLNTKLGILLAYDFGDSYATKPIGEVADEIISKIETEERRTRIDFACVVSRGMFLPMFMEGGTATVALFDDTVGLKCVPEAEKSVGLFFVVLLTTLNQLRLANPDLFRYFNQ